MKSDKEIVGILLGFDDYVSILAICMWAYYKTNQAIAEFGVSLAFSDIG